MEGVDGISVLMILSVFFQYNASVVIFLFDHFSQLFISFLLISQDLSRVNMKQSVVGFLLTRFLVFSNGMLSIVIFLF